MNKMEAGPRVIENAKRIWAIAIDALSKRNGIMPPTDSGGGVFRERLAMRASVRMCR